VTIPGRVVVDVLPLVRRDFKLKRYGLGSVSKEILGKDKLDVAHTEIPTLWKSRGSGLEKLVEYSRRDAQLTLEILVSKNLLDRYVALAQASGTFLQDLIEAGQSIMIDNLLLRELRKYDRVMPCKPDDQETGRRREVRESEGLKGGHVLDPEAGLQENVIVMDYKSLYPTIMIANNICFSTLQGREFIARDKYKGIVPRILEGLLEKRQILKAKAKKAKGPEDFRILDMTQWAVKILLNSFYGYFGYLRSRMYELIIANAVTSMGRDTIVRTKEIIENEIGRAALHEGQVFLKEGIDSGPEGSIIVSLKVVYGDTDSVFVKIDPENREAEIGDREAVALGGMMAKILTGLLPPPMELQYEAFAKRSLFVTKKRYALYSEGMDPAIKVKGLETVRREWCNLATEAMKTVLSLLLEKGDVEQASEYMKDLIKDLRNNRITVDRLVQTRSLSKRPQEYKGRQPHLELYHKIKERDPASAPQIGDRVPFVITHGKGLLVERAEDPTYVTENDIRIDHDYYINRQIIPPVRRIFEALGLGIDELVADHQQRTLLDAFGAGGVEKPLPKVKPLRRQPVLGVELEEIVCTNCSKGFTVIDLSDFTCPECGEELVQESCTRILLDVVELAKRAASEGGTRAFVCGNCGKDYRRIPLTGTCDCAGQIVPKSVDVEVAPLMELVEAAPQSMRNGNLDLQIEMIRTNFDSLRSKEAPQLTLADYL
jgi:DNA polymerase I